MRTIIHRVVAIALIIPALLAAREGRSQWTPANWPHGQVANFASFANTVLYGGHDRELYRSLDSGKSWRPLGTLPSTIQKIASHGNNVFAVTEYGLYRSSDSGNAWALSGLVGRNVTSFTSWNSLILAGTDKGVFLSSDQGITWTAQDSSIKYPLPFVHQLERSGSNILEVEAEYSSLNYLYSLDSGKSWSPAKTGLTGLTDVNSLTSVGTDVYATAGTDLYRSTDQGINWSKLYSFISVAYGFVSIDNALFVATDSGVFRSSNSGKNWSVENNGLTYYKFLYALDSVGPYLIGSTELGFFRSTNNGTNWVPANAGYANDRVTCFVSNGDYLFAGTLLADADVSSDGGGDWTASSTIDILNLGINSLCAIGSNAFAGCLFGIIRSTDDGVSWTKENNGLPSNNSSGDVEVTALCASRASLYAGVQDAGVYRSTDLGMHWTAANAGISDSYILSLFALGSEVFASVKNDGIVRSNDGMTWTPSNTGLPQNANVSAMSGGSGLLYAGIGSAIYYSSDSGSSWFSTPSQMADSSVNALCSYQLNLFAGTDKGVFVSTDMGVSWVSANLGLPDSAVVPLRAMYSLYIAGTYLLGGYSYLGVWRRPLSDFGISSVATQPASDESLSNYPNPFTNSTTINITAKESGFATVSIVNQLGIEVSRVFAGEIGAGEHSFQWVRPANVPPGMYECIVRVSGHVERAGMIIEP